MLTGRSAVLFFVLFVATSGIIACEDYDGEFDGVALEDNGGDAAVRSTVAGTYQAEDFTFKSGCTKRTNHSGYTGSGFMDYGGNGTLIEWNNINVSADGQYTLAFRYANGSTGNRQCAITVNDKTNGNVTFAKTGAWTSWKTDSIEVSLQKGLNKIRVTANTGSGGPNLDKMDLFQLDQTGGENPIITASGENLPREGKDKAFDGRKETKWLTFADSAWIQYDFAGDLSKMIGEYRITSANDAKERDPRDWRLLGSNDGRNWTTLDSRSGEEFSARFQARTFAVSNPGKYQMYRLNILSNLDPPRANSTQLAELELLEGQIVADECPNDPAKTEPGECGCGVPEGTCGGGGSGPNFKIEILTDAYAVEDDTRWEIVNTGTNKVVAVGDKFENNTKYVKELSLPDGIYEITFFDKLGDGVMDKQKGHVTVFLYDEEMFTEWRFKETKRLFRIGRGHALSARDTEWLVAHNNRRRNYDPDGDNLPFVPLRWSAALAAEAQAWAEELLTNSLKVTDQNGNEVIKTACNPDRSLRRTTPGELHDHNTGHGENITMRIGSGDWGKDKPPAQLVEGPWARSSSHNSQMVWRASHYIGCGSVSLVEDPNFTGFNCQIYVCRFARTGNCVGYSWKDDYSGCGPSPCPPDGCYSYYE